MKNIILFLFLTLPLPISAYDQSRDASGAFYTNTVFGLCQITAKKVVDLLSKESVASSLSRTEIERRVARLDRQYSQYFKKLGFPIEEQTPGQAAESVLEFAEMYSEDPSSEGLSLLYQMLVWECIKESRVGVDN
ncbi:hypothetical protein [Alcanivorax quisquiliarum]|uniref:Type VI secretion system (T6SS), amidase immunity protein n=1 Tax=Alcanivorax quisquiliarum TaxID=2933565 RepID=A0ABT0E8E5_9GAMM|nr:hypothetical protein [Alcanivorax quisquiliarum]MCK0538023.1 hypothetical protein [Alcanivorax quisquiliarum]